MDEITILNPDVGRQAIRPGDIVRKMRRPWNGTKDQAAVAQKRLFVVLIARGNAKGTQSLWLFPLEGDPLAGSGPSSLELTVTTSDKVALVCAEALRFRGPHAQELRQLFRHHQQGHVDRYNGADCSKWVYQGDIDVMEEP